MTYAAVRSLSTPVSRRILPLSVAVDLSSGRAPEQTSAQTANQGESVIIDFPMLVVRWG